MRHLEHGAHTSVIVSLSNDPELVEGPVPSASSGWFDKLTMTQKDRSFRPVFYFMAGAAGFEPTHGGVKVHCITPSRERDGAPKV